MSEPAVILRLAQSRERSRLQAIELDAARRFLSLPDYAFCAALPCRDQAEHERVQRTGAALVIERASVVGAFALLLPIDGAAHLLELAVQQAWQGHGDGRRLIAAAEEWAVRRGYAHITLSTFRDVPWNAPFYARLGFEVFEPEPYGHELRQLLAEEIAAGVAQRARVAMRKALGSTMARGERP